MRFFVQWRRICIVYLSNFYLDIIKDRLYVSKRCDIVRKSAQTTIWVILSVIVKLLAPILSFTCEEIWEFIPKLDNLESVFLSDIEIGYKIDFDSSLEDYWCNILNIAGLVKKALEDARANKIIGSSLEADVYLKDSLISKDASFLEDLKEICMVSRIISSKQEADVNISKSKFDKCQRCWMFDESVGKSSEYPDICERCIKVLY